MVKKVRENKWSLDTCVGRAKLKRRFPTSTIPSTKTLYNLLWNGELPLTLFDVPEALNRRQRGKPRISKCLDGKSIDERPVEVVQRTIFGHWESNTVLGKKKKGEAAVFTIVERLTGCYLTIRIDAKTIDGVACAMEQLKEHLVTNLCKYSTVLLRITAVNSHVL